MKRYLLTISVILTALSASAQFEDHKVLLGGSANYGTTNNTANSLSFGIRPRLAYAITPSTAIGAYVGYSGFAVTADDSNTKSNSHTIEFGAFYQKYYPIAEKIFFNWEVSAGTAQTRTKTVQDGQTTSASPLNSFGTRFSPGLTWKAMDRLLLNATVGRVGYSFTKVNNINNHSFDISFNSPSFGFILLLK